MSVRNTRKRKALAFAVLCSLLLVLTCTVFPHALGATNDTSNGVAVIAEDGTTKDPVTEDGSEKDPAAADDAEKVEGAQGEEGAQEGDEPADGSVAEGTDNSDKSEGATGEEAPDTSEEKAPTASENSANVSEQEAANDDSGVAPAAVNRITAEQYVTNSKLGSFVIDSSMEAGEEKITGEWGMTVANIAATAAARNGL